MNFKKRNKSGDKAGQNPIKELIEEEIKNTLDKVSRLGYACKEDANFLIAAYKYEKTAREKLERDYTESTKYTKRLVDEANKFRVIALSKIRFFKQELSILQEKLVAKGNIYKGGKHD